MATPITASERHYELWKHREKRLSQLIVGTTLFALLGEWRVVRPSLQNATKYAALETQSALLAKELEQENARIRALKPLEDALDRVDATVRSEPWRQVVEEFKAEFAHMRSAAALVSRDLEQARRILAKPDAFFLQARPGEEEQLGPGQFQAVQEGPYLQAAPNAPPAMQEAGEFQSLPEGVEKAAALGLLSLRIDPAEAQASSPSDLVDRIEAAMRRRGEELAREKVALISRSVAGEVSEPLADAIEAAKGQDIDLSVLEEALAENSRRMDRWAKEHLVDRNWYRSETTKSATVTDLTLDLRDWQERFSGIVEAQRESIDEAREEADAAIKKVDADKETLRVSQAELRDHVKELLPAWIRGLVTPAELARTYPIILAVLGGLIAALAVLVRHHFQRCRDESFGLAKTRQDAAFASCWTLVFRGRRGTLWTLSVWLLLLAGWYGFTRVGLNQAESLWNDRFLGEPLCALSWLAISAWALWLAPFLALIGAVLVLIDAKAPERSSEVRSTGR